VVVEVVCIRCGGGQEGTTPVAGIRLSERRSRWSADAS
jgi:hypothetical protein